MHISQNDFELSDEIINFACKESITSRTAIKIKQSLNDLYHDMETNDGPFHLSVEHHVIKTIIIWAVYVLIFNYFCFF